jgi:hypothetical protein
MERDLQLQYLQWLIPLPHREIGVWPMKDVPFHFTNGTGNPDGLTERAAPCYSKKSDSVYGELGKLTP